MTRRIRLWAGLALWASASPALAHVTGTPHEEAGWTLTPWLLACLGLSLLAFLIGAARLATRSDRGRTGLAKRCVLFLGGWLVLGLAAVSPLHAAGERSFALHMVEHELIMLVAAPLLVLSRPLGAMVWALPREGRRFAGRVVHLAAVGVIWNGLTGAVAATLLQIAALWLWHVPSLFDLALRDPGWHIVQHLSFLLSALLFWTAMVGRRDARAGVVVICLFLTSLLTGALGALMALSDSPWYERYRHLGMTPWGLTAAEDQQLAGLLMWIPGGLVHAGVALAVLARMIILTERTAGSSTRDPSRQSQAPGVSRRLPLSLRDGGGSSGR